MLYRKRNLMLEKLKSYMKDLSLRQKFSISTSLVLIVCFALFTLYLLIDQNFQIKKNLQKNSEKYAELIVLSNTEHLWDFNLRGLEFTCKAFYTNPEIAAIRIKDNRGNILLSLDDKKVHSLEPPITKPIFKNDRLIGELELIVTKDEYYNTLSSIVIRLVGLFVIIFSITLLSVREISRRVLKPLNEMIIVVDRISHGDMSKGIAIESNDEIGRLAVDFNNMMYRVKESIDSIKAIIEFMPSIIIQLDLEGRVILWNRLAEKFTGVSLEDAKGKSLKDIKPEIAEYLFNPASMNSSEKPFSLYSIHIKGYKDIYFNLFIFHLKLEHSESIVLRIDDITELKKQEVQIRQKQRLESLGFLSSGIAHDFNNILGGIIGTVSLIRYRIEKGTSENLSKLDKDLALIENSCQSGAGIVSQLLSLSNNEINADMQKLDLNEIMRNVTDICMKTFDKSILFSIKEFEDKAYAVINGPQIQQTLLNLCINASHSMTIMREDKSLKEKLLDIGITKVFADRFFLQSHPESAEGEYWRLYVRDNGVGMDSKTISKIFDPFFTTKSRTFIRGTGLGLSVVHSTIQAHKGFIDVFSNVGEGTIFSLYIPVAEIDDSFIDEPPPSVCNGEGTILVVDDDEIIRNYTKAMLEECGYSVITGSDGALAVDLYKKNSSAITLVLLDMVMPVKSGRDALADLLKLNPDLKVIMTSGLYSKQIIDDVFKSGASGFIEKPYSIVQLSQKICSILKKQ